MAVSQRDMPRTAAVGMTTALRDSALKFPEPPSAGLYWRLWRGKIVKTAQARAYQQGVYHQALAEGRRPIEDCDVKVSLWWRPSSRRGDLDNRLKVILDALQGALYENDRQVVELHAYRLDATKPGWVLVEVEPA